MCTTYILYSNGLDKFYIGHTCEELPERLRKHNTNHRGFTGKANDWNVVYHESHPNKQAAYAWERQIKDWKNRERIEQLIAKNSEHPD